MELIASLPPELAATVDPAARGAAPLLRPTDSAGDTLGVPTPFALCLELLAAVAPPGEGLPAAGNDLPQDAPDTGAGADAALAAAAAFVPPPFLESVPPPPIASGGVAPQAAGPAASPVPMVPLPAAVPPPSAAAPATITEPDAAPAVATPLAEVAVATGAPAPSPAAEGPDHAATPQPLATAALRDALLAATATRTAPQAAAAAAPSAAAPLSAAEVSASAAAPVVEVVARSARAAQRDAVAAPVPVPVPSLGQSPDVSGAPTQWLSGAATQHGPATSPAAAHSARPSAQQASVDLRSPTWPEALASRVQWHVDTRVGEARITLNPPELGAVDVKISLVDEQTFVHLTAATASARDELAQGLPRLRELFTASGLELGGASVESGHARHHDTRGDVATESRASELRALMPFAADETQPHARAAGRIDVFA